LMATALALPGVLGSKKVYLSCGTCCSTMASKPRVQAFALSMGSMVFNSSPSKRVCPQVMEGRATSSKVMPVGGRWKYLDVAGLEPDGLAACCRAV